MMAPVWSSKNGSKRSTSSSVSARSRTTDGRRSRTTDRRKPSTSSSVRDGTYDVNKSSNLDDNYEEEVDSNSSSSSSIDDTEPLEEYRKRKLAELEAVQKRQFLARLQRTSESLPEPSVPMTSGDMDSDDESVSSVETHRKKDRERHYTKNVAAYNRHKEAKAKEKAERTNAKGDDIFSESDSDRSEAVADKNPQDVNPPRPQVRCLTEEAIYVDRSKLPPNLFTFRNPVPSQETSAAPSKKQDRKISSDKENLSSSKQPAEPAMQVFEDSVEEGEQPAPIISKKRSVAPVDSDMSSSSKRQRVLETQEKNVEDENNGDSPEAQVIASPVRGGRTSNNDQMKRKSLTQTSSKTRSKGSEAAPTPTPVAPPARDSEIPSSSARQRVVETQDINAGDHIHEHSPEAQDMFLTSTPYHKATRSQDQLNLSPVPGVGANMNDRMKKVILTQKAPKIKFPIRPKKPEAPTKIPVALPVCPDSEIRSSQPVVETQDGNIEDQVFEHSLEAQVSATPVPDVGTNNNDQMKRVSQTQTGSKQYPTRSKRSDAPTPTPVAPPAPADPEMPSSQHVLEMQDVNVEDQIYDHSRGAQINAIPVPDVGTNNNDQMKRVILTQKGSKSRLPIPSKKPDASTPTPVAPLAPADSEMPSSSNRERVLETQESNEEDQIFEHSPEAQANATPVPHVGTNINDEMKKASLIQKVSKKYPTRSKRSEAPTPTPVVPPAPADSEMPSSSTRQRELESQDKNVEDSPEAQVNASRVPDVGTNNNDRMKKAKHTQKVSKKYSTRSKRSEVSTPTLVASTAPADSEIPSSSNRQRELESQDNNVEDQVNEHLPEAQVNASPVPDVETNNNDRKKKKASVIQKASKKYPTRSKKPEAPTPTPVAPPAPADSEKPSSSKRQRVLETQENNVEDENGDSPEAQVIASPVRGGRTSNNDRMKRVSLTQTSSKTRSKRSDAPTPTPVAAPARDSEIPSSSNRQKVLETQDSNEENQIFEHSPEAQSNASVDRGVRSINNDRMNKAKLTQKVSKKHSRQSKRSEVPAPTSVDPKATNQSNRELASQSSSEVPLSQQSMASSRTRQARRRSIFELARSTAVPESRAPRPPENIPDRYVGNDVFGNYHLMKDEDIASILNSQKPDHGLTAEEIKQFSLKVNHWLEDFFVHHCNQSQIPYGFISFSHLKQGLIDQCLLEEEATGEDLMVEMKRNMSKEDWKRSEGILYPSRFSKTGDTVEFL